MMVFTIKLFRSSVLKYINHNYQLGQEVYVSVTAVKKQVQTPLLKFARNLTNNQISIRLQIIK